MLMFTCIQLLINQGIHISNFVEIDLSFWYRKDTINYVDLDLSQKSNVVIIGEEDKTDYAVLTINKK